MVDDEMMVKLDVCLNPNSLCADSSWTMIPQWLPTHKPCQPISFICTWCKLPLAWRLSYHLYMSTSVIWRVHIKRLQKGNKLSSSYNAVQMHKCVQVHLRASGFPVKEVMVAVWQTARQSGVSYGFLSRFAQHLAEWLNYQKNLHRVNSSSYIR